MDNVNHPQHYQGKHECIEIMRALFGDEAVKGFCKCNSFKYRFRSDNKNGEEDIKKAEWYEDYLMQMESEEQSRTNKTRSKQKQSNVNATVCESSPVRQFVEECCVHVDPKSPRPSYTSRQDIFNAFKRYCEDCNIDIRGITLQKFGAELAEIIGVPREQNEERVKDQRGKQYRVFKFFELSPTQKEVPNDKARS